MSKSNIINHESTEWMFPFFNYIKITASTVISTWIIIGIITLLIIYIRYSLKNKHKIIHFISLSTTQSFIDLCRQTCNTLHYRHFSYITSLFIFILLCNIASLFPFLEEPTANLNTTFALAFFSFLYINFHAIQTHGIRNYCKEFLQPFFLMAPLHIIGKITPVVSLSFRLFGNMLGGSIISSLWIKLITQHWLFALLGIISGANCIFAFIFGICEGVIQAFVFCILTLTFLSIDIAPTHSTEK